MEPAGEWEGFSRGPFLMINRADLVDRVREWSLLENVVEKDYVIGWVLWGIGSEPRLSDGWAFKGGTCLKKCYLETYRFSEDLDFTVLPGGLIEPDELLPVLKDVLDRVYQESGIDFSGREPLLRVRRDPASVEGRVYYRGPVGAPMVASLKLDLTSAEQVVRPTVLREINHHYPDVLPPPAVVRCYGFEEVFAEKLRAMGQRSRPRDLYDIVNLFRRGDFLPHWELVNSVYTEKCHSKGLDVFNLDDLTTSPFREELESEWSNMLAHQLPALPPFEEFWNELPRLFGWLTGQDEAPELLPPVVAESESDGWTPPSTAWVWGHGVPFESVRFAAANHLCVELGYQGGVRVIEPYSLRQSREGNLLLYGVRTDTGAVRSYRVDRITSVRVLSVPFRPRYRVEMTTSRPLVAPPVASRAGTHSVSRPLGRRNAGRSSKGKRGASRMRVTRPAVRRRPKRR